MEYLAAATLGLCALALGFDLAFWLRVRVGRRAWRRVARAAPPDRWPSIRVVVCLKGPLPRLAETVGALAAQDYPGEWGVTFVTEAGPGDGDPAADAIRGTLPADARFAHVVAGRVLEMGRRRAQKNQNLLAGVAETERRHGRPDAWAFLDGDLVASPDWLREMVRPIAVGAGEATTSFHGVEPRGPGVVPLLHVLLETSQSLALLVCRGATWGGSVAVRSDTFRRLGLGDLWGRTVVDDVAMSRAMKESRLRVVTVPRLLVRSRGALADYGRLVRWLGRQYFFVKVYMPSRFRLLWTKACLNLAVYWLAAFHGGWRLLDGAWPAGAVAGWAALSAAAAVVASTSLAARSLPSTVPPVRWLLANLLFSVTNWLGCADAARRRSCLTWRDLTYDLDREGRVSGVRPARAHEPSALGEVPDEPLPGEAAA